MKEVKTYAEVLLQRGVPYDEILKEPSLKGVTRAQLRMWKSRLNKGENKTAKIATPKADATPLATIATELQRGEATQETAAKPIKNAAETPVFVDFIKTALQNFHPVDALYYLGVAICCTGVAGVLHGVGIAVSVVIAGVAVIALQGLKTETEWRRRVKYALAFLGVEVVAAISHMAWANAALWENVRALPFDIAQTWYTSPDTGKVVTIWIGSQTAWPFYTACGVAVVLFLSGVFTFFISIQNKK